MRALWFATFSYGLLVACGEDAPNPPPRDASSDVQADVVSDVVSDVTSDVVEDAQPVRGPARVVVERYDYNLDITTRRVTSRLTLRVVTAGDCLTIGFRHVAAENVTFNDVAAREVMVANDTLLACDGNKRGWAAGSMVTLSVTSTERQTTLMPTQVGFSTRTSMGGQRFTYLLSWVGECARHGPCDATPSAFAQYQFTVAHPKGVQILCPGTVEATDTQTVCNLTQRAPTYTAFGVMALAGGWRQTSLGSAGNVDVTLYDTMGSRVTDTIDRPNTTGFLNWMIDRFGTYPYGTSMRLVSAPTYWAGFEHPGNISLAETLPMSGRMDHTIRHEIAHQWAGNQATLATVKDFVWKEAMAEYLAYVYEDETNGLSDVANTTLSIWRDASARADHWAIPNEDIPLSTFYGSSYGPGPMILFRQLEVMFSRMQVINALRMLISRERALSIDDVRMALEATTGAQLGNYFSAWLRGTGAPAWPGVAVTRTSNTDGTVSVAVRVQTRDAVVRPCKFTVRLTGEGGRRLDVPFVVGLDGSQPQAAMVRPDFTVTGEVLNPLYEALVFPMTMPGGAMWIEYVPTPGYDPFRAP
jgi:aminopeptidase N